MLGPKWLANFNKNKIGLLLVSALICGNVSAQDIHLSHIHASPTFLNPAMTGLFNQDLRLIANYRSQWNSFTNGYRTFVASADMKAYRGVGLRDEIGLGIQLMADKAGDLDFSHTSAALSMSYLKALNDDGSHFISTGLQIGMIQNRLNLEDLRVFDEDPALISESFNNRINYLDISAGMGWFAPIGLRNDNVYVGFSMYHINRAFVSFFDNENNQSEESLYLFEKYTLHGGATIRVNKFSTLKPSFIFHDQGPHREFNVGTFFKMMKEYKTYIRPEYAIYFGAWFRWSNKSGEFNRDAIIGSIRYDYKDYIASFSFDINVSSLSRASRFLGGPELSLIKLFDFDRPERRRTRVKCPDFQQSGLLL